MRVVSISRSGLEIERFALVRPTMTVGRSPSCDVVLRAANVAPVHFLVERIDASEAEDGLGEWSVVDISRSFDGPSEGMLLDKEAVECGGFRFRIEEDRLEARPEIGGAIQERLASERARKLPVLPVKPGQGHFLEIAQVRIDSGAVEEILHLDAPSRRSVLRPLKGWPQVELAWDPSAGSGPVRILLRQLPGVRLWSRQGAQLANAPDFALSLTDLARLSSAEREIYLRFVPRVPAPETPRAVVEDRFFAALLGWIFLPLFLLILSRALFYEEPPAPIVPPPRVATVEVKAPIEVVPEPPPAPPPPAVVAAEAPPPKAPQAPPAGLDQVKPKPQEKAADAAAARFRAAPQDRPRAGLNSPAKPADINRVGVLGALAKSKSAAKGPGVRPDLILNDAIKTEAVAGRDDSTAAITLQNPPSGALGAGHGGAGGTEDGPDLSEASTSLSGVGNPDPRSMGPIARRGGKGAGFGAALEGGGTGIGAGSSLGTLSDSDSVSISGGLDRETVRRVVAGYRGRIRTCYEQALVRKPKVQGRVLFRWTISPSGPVLIAQKQSSTLSDGPLENCVLEVVRGMIFPAAPNKQPTVVIYPFVFEAKR
jgi:outer membrane biosynthesis protein TonB